MKHNKGESVWQLRNLSENSGQLKLSALEDSITKRIRSVHYQRSSKKGQTTIFEKQELELICFQEKNAVDDPSKSIPASWSVKRQHFQFPISALKLLKRDCPLEFALINTLFLISCGYDTSLQPKSLYLALGAAFNI